MTTVTPDQFADGTLTPSGRARQARIWVYDIDGVKVNTLSPGIMDLEYDVRLQSLETLRVVLPADSPKAVYLAEDVQLEWNDTLFYVSEVNGSRTEDGIATVEAIAEAQWMRLGERKYVGNLSLVNVGAASGLDYMLDDTGWTHHDDIDQIAGVFNYESQDISRLAQIWAWAKIVGKEVQFDTRNRIVNFVDQVGADRGMSFRYGRNLTSITRTARPPRATRLFAYGRDDLDLTGVTGGAVPYIEDYSFYTAQGMTDVEAAALYRRDEILVDRDITDDTTLLAVAERQLAVWSEPFVKYQAGVQDLSNLISTPDATFFVGDTVQVYDRVFDWSFTTRVVRRQRFPLEPWRDQVELATLEDPQGDDRTTSRPKSSAEWVLFEDYTATIRKVRGSLITLARLDLTAAPGAEWVVGYTLQGVGVGTGYLTVTFTNKVDGSTLWPAWVIPITPGLQVRESLTWGEKDIAPGDYSIRVKAQGSATGVGINIGTDDSGDTAGVLDTWLQTYGQTLIVMDIGS